MYFNNEKDATNFIVDYVLPFINADYEVDKKINKIIKSNSKEIKDIIFSSKDNNKLEKTLQKNKEEIAELVKLKESEIKTSFIDLRNKCIDLHNTKIIDDRFIMGYQEIDTIPNDLINYLIWLLKTPFKLNNIDNKNAKDYEKEIEAGRLVITFRKMDYMLSLMFAGVMNVAIQLSNYQRNLLF